MKGQKKCPVPAASTEGTCLYMVNIENAPMPEVPRHLHLVARFQEGVLEIAGPMKQCFSRFPIISQRSRGGDGKKEEERYGKD